MKCKNCGAEIKNGNMYCSVCGSELQLVPEYNISDDELLREMIDDREEKKKAKEEERLRQQKEEAKAARKKKTLKAVICGLIGLIVIVVLLIAVFTGKRHKNSYDYQYKMALEQYSDANYSKAIEYLNTALSINGKSVDARVLMGQCYMALEDYESAIEVLLEAVEIDPTSRDAYSLLIEIYNTQDDYENILALAKDVTNDDILSLFGDYLVSAPIISIRGGEYDDVLKVEISSEDNLSIYYTTDGSEPTEQSQIYGGAIEIGDGETTLSAICVDEKGRSSLVSEETYVITLTTPEAPSVSLSSGTYTSQMEINVSVPDGATAYYTWDGSTPTASSSVYSGPLKLLEGNNIFSVIICDKNGMYSSVTSRTYVYLPPDEEVQEDTALSIDTETEE